MISLGRIHQRIVVTQCECMPLICVTMEACGPADAEAIEEILIEG